LLFERCKNADSNLRKTWTHVSEVVLMFFMNIITSVGSSVPLDVSPTVKTVEAYTNLVIRHKRVE
jgi:hypothetical protein